MGESPLGSRGAILTVLKFEIGSLVSNVYCLLADSPTFSPRLLVELNLDHIVNVLRPDMFLESLRQVFLFSLG